MAALTPFAVTRALPRLNLHGHARLAGGGGAGQPSMVVHTRLQVRARTLGRLNLLEQLPGTPTAPHSAPPVAHLRPLGYAPT